MNARNKQIRQQNDKNKSWKEKKPFPKESVEKRERGELEQKSARLYAFFMYFFF